MLLEILFVCANRPETPAYFRLAAVTQSEACLCDGACRGDRGGCVALALCRSTHIPGPSAPGIRAAPHDRVYFKSRVCYDFFFSFLPSFFQLGEDVEFS